MFYFYIPTYQHRIWMSNSYINIRLGWMIFLSFDIRVWLNMISKYLHNVNTKLYLNNSFYFEIESNVLWCYRISFSLWIIYKKNCIFARSMNFNTVIILKVNYIMINDVISSREFTHTHILSVIKWWIINTIMLIWWSFELCSNITYSSMDKIISFNFWQILRPVKIITI